VRSLAASRVVVIGLGLMGGSLAGALRGRCRTVVGVARRSETVDLARGRGLIDRGTTDVRSAVANADIVVFATPVRIILRQLPEVGPLLPDGCLVLDLGSTKAQILEAMAALPPHVEPLGGHPMCGRELSGIEAADVSLYRERTFILSPLERTSAEAIERGRELVAAVGASPLLLDAARQDRLVATLSHLPYLLACSLVRTADATTSPDPAAWEIVAGGYRDTSRVAGSDVTMMLDILVTNRDAVLAAASVFRDKLDELTRLLAAEDEPALRDLLVASRTERRRMFP